MEIDDVVSERSVAFDNGARDLDGFVGGIVEHLDLQLLARIIHLADAVDQAIDDVLFIEDGKLNGDARQFGEVRFRFRDLVLAVLVIKIDQLIAMHSVERQRDQHDEVRNQQRHVEGVGVIEPFERGVEEVRLQIMAKPVRFHQCTSQSAENDVQKRTPYKPRNRSSNTADDHGRSTSLKLYLSDSRIRYPLKELCG